MSNIQEFFELNNITKKYYSTGKKNLSIDGTGILPSVDTPAGTRILNYIKKFYFPDTSINILDVGAGVGHLTKASDSFNTINCYSFEGCSDLVPHVVCDKTKFAIVDLTETFTDKLLYKQFDLTTSFEVLEHVHRSHQDTFWKNLAFFSNKHLCSIHVANEEHDEHCTIQPLNVWLDYLKDKGKVTVLGLYPQNLDTAEHTFRKECNLYNWDCSIMLYIEFYN
uniref:Methyltransferase domain-containing protein n=1 Tax=viral metagenome TaxID=1070528 RepID=A0A6C0JX39_9ZZZZ